MMVWLFAGAGGAAPLPISHTALIALMVALLCLSFLFSGTETALFSLQKVDQQRLLQSGRSGRRLVPLLSRRSAVITTILIGNETVNITLAATGADLFGGLTDSALLNSWLNILIVTPTLVLLSEITPKVLAFRFNTTWARAIGLPLLVFYGIITPLRFVVQGLVGLIARSFGVTPSQRNQGLGEEELLTLLDQGTAAGTVDSRELEMIENVFEFDDLTVGRIMTPRPDLFCVPLHTGWTGILSRCRESGFSRVPLYSGSPDDIVGVMLLKDMLKHQAQPPTGARQLRSLLIPPIFVPQSKPATDMLQEFLRDKSHMAFVVDEHGTLVGLVTLDDLLEELFGDLPDEDADGPSIIEHEQPGTFIINASMDIDDFRTETELEIPEGDYHTVGGFVFHQLGRLPRRGDAVTWEEHRFIVRTMNGRRVSRLLVRIATPLTDEVEVAG